MSIKTRFRGLILFVRDESFPYVFRILDIADGAGSLVRLMPSGYNQPTENPNQNP